MKFKDYLISELNICDAMRPRDVAKMCYQAAFGAEHLLLDLDRAREFFDSEFDATEKRDVPLYQFISENVARVDLGAWKKSGMPKEWLFDLFVMATKENYGGKKQMLDNLDLATEIVSQGMAGFSVEDWDEFLKEYKASGINPVHHSQEYRDAKAPAYRLVDRKHLRIIPILVWAANREGGVIVIDGPCASGKSTMAAQLSKILDGPVIRVDDFFLPMELRTEERLAEAGGNVHYERFKDEILPGLLNGESFEYTRFDCSVMGYGESVKIPANKWRIVEGSYSHHPYFGEYGDVRVFSMIDYEEQIGRILSRNGEEMTNRFEKMWIPMENKYFEEYNISELADLRV